MLPRCYPASPDCCYSCCFLSCKGVRIKKDLPRKMFMRLKSITRNLPSVIPLSRLNTYTPPTLDNEIQPLFSVPRNSSQFLFWILGSHNLPSLSTYTLLDHFQGWTQEKEPVTCVIFQHDRNWKANFNIIVVRGYWKRKKNSICLWENSSYSQNQWPTYSLCFFRKCFVLYYVWLIDAYTMKHTLITHCSLYTYKIL